jgi:uncharacterized membrane protein SpoIIM required for sporulation
MLAIGLALTIAFLGGWYLSTAYTLPLDRQAPSNDPNPIAAFDRAIETRRLVESSSATTVHTPGEEVSQAAIDVFASWDAAIASAQPVENTVQVAPWEYSDETLLNNLRDLWETASRDPAFIGLALGQNMRVLALAFILGLFTFGVLSTIIVIFPFAILGYIFGNIAANGISMWPFVMAVIPHGIAEIPAILIAAALIMHAGSAVTGEMDKLTVGEVWLRAIGDAVKTYFAIVVPLLIIAATLEVMVTPRMVELALEIGF